MENDPVAFYALMTGRGWTWPVVLSWLAAPPTAGFFDLAPDRRRRAADHLERLPAARGEGGGHDPDVRHRRHPVRFVVERR